jgi:hypothetical protein
LQVWNNTQYTGKVSNGPPTPGVSTLQLPSSGSALYQGCYAEASGFRALNGTSETNSLSMTLELCAAFCQKGHYSLFGLEYYDVGTNQLTSNVNSDQTRNATAQRIRLRPRKLERETALTTVWETVRSSVALQPRSAFGVSTTRIMSLQLLQPYLSQLQQALELPCRHQQSRLQSQAGLASILAASLTRQVADLCLPTTSTTPQ